MGKNLIFNQSETNLKLMEHGLSTHLSQSGKQEKTDVVLVIRLY